MNGQIILSTKSTNSKSTKRRRNRSVKQNPPRKRGTAQRTRQRRRLQPQGVVRQKFQLSKCSRDYLKALVDPFGHTDPVCVPDLYDIPSAKYKTLARGTLKTGQLGFGFIQTAVFGLLANNQYLIFTSDSNFNNSYTSNDLNHIGVVAYYNTQAPYPLASFGVDEQLVQGRVVALGIRVRYIGSNLNLGGRMAMFRPIGTTSTSGVNMGEALANRTTVSVPVTRQWRSVSWLPTRSSDYDYKSAINTADGIMPKMAILIESEPGNLFEYEVVMCSEYVGAVTNVSASHSDVQGMSAVRDAICNVETVPVEGPQNFNRFLNYITDAGTAFLSSPAAGKFVDAAAQKVITYL